MKPGYCIVQDVQTGQVIGRRIEKGELYYLEEMVQNGKAVIDHGSKERQLWTWHQRLAHPSLGYLEKFFPVLAGLNSNLKCETCILAKSHKHTYSSSMNNTDLAFMLFHSDVRGPAPEIEMHGFSYYVIFIDDCTQMSWIYFLKHKSEVFGVFVNFYNMICSQFQTHPRVLRTDNGREYVNSNMHQFITSKGLIHQTSCPDTPQQNGVAERKNRTLLEITRAIMLESHVPTYLWPEIVATVNYLINRLPTKALNYKTPLETLQIYQSIPSFHSWPPRIFGCKVYVHYPKRMHHKLEPRADSVFLFGAEKSERL